MLQCMVLWWTNHSYEFGHNYSISPLQYHIAWYEITKKNHLPGSTGGFQKTFPGTMSRPELSWIPCPGPITHQETEKKEKKNQKLEELTFPLHCWKLSIQKLKPKSTKYSYESTPMYFQKHLQTFADPSHDLTGEQSRLAISFPQHVLLARSLWYWLSKMCQYILVRPLYAHVWV